MIRLWQSELHLLIICILCRTDVENRNGRLLASRVSVSTMIEVLVAVLGPA